jgi:hypothetical protein
VAAKKDPSRLSVGWGLQGIPMFERIGHTTGSWERHTLRKINGCDRYAKALLKKELPIEAASSIVLIQVFFVCACRLQSYSGTALPQRARSRPHPRAPSSQSWRFRACKPTIGANIAGCCKHDTRGFCHRFRSRTGNTPKIVPVASIRRKPSGSWPGWRVATTPTLALAAAIASSALAKTEVSLSTGMPPLSQSIANNAVSSANDCGSAIITAAGTMCTQK